MTKYIKGQRSVMGIMKQKQQMGNLIKDRAENHSKRRLRKY